MTQKRKPKSNSPLDVLFDNVLFVKRYRFETSLPIDTTVDRLHELSHELHGWFYRKPRYVVNSTPMIDHIALDIRAKESRQHYTVAHTTAQLYSDQNTTIIEGEIRFGIVYFVFMLLSVIWMFFLFQWARVQLPMWIVLFALAIPIYNFAQMIHHRNKLLNKIETAMTPRMSDRQFPPKKSHQRLHNQQDEHHYEDDHPSETSRYDQQ